MADEKAGELPPAVTSYLQDGEGDLSYRLVTIGQGDSNISNMDKINTDVAKTPKTTVAADDSPVSDAGTTHSWENISHSDANDVAMAE
ncbi:hypothetical protein A0O28_0100810 [Trichoderma guizhouense]|uniref:Uncharacterized protein n=1 Tax=Trichoderma guizhouense TaxID=1491466 RepID=A0A1T3C9L7_9HYPO|nr:hypothetical protein A0O28_0100810 [Trichoderma guizhouense]